MALTNMQLSTEEAKTEDGAPDAAENGPRYPYGLCLYLDKDSMEKLGITDLPEVGASISIIARADVTSISARKSQGGEDSKSIDLQITDLSIGGAGPDLMTKSAKMLYGDGK